MKCKTCSRKPCRCRSPSKATRHWLMQRLTAIVLLPLSLWILLMFFSHPFSSYEGARAWMKTPQGTIALSSIISILCYHSALGLQVVLEDYLSTPWLRHIMIIFEKTIFLLLFLLALTALWKIHYSAG